MKLKTVTEIRRSSARDTFVDEGVFELNSLPLDWEPEERLKRGVVWSVLLFFSFLFFQYEASSTVFESGNCKVCFYKVYICRSTFQCICFSGNTEASPLTQL